MALTAAQREKLRRRRTQRPMPNGRSSLTPGTPPTSATPGVIKETQQNTQVLPSQAAQVPTVTPASTVRPAVRVRPNQQVTVPIAGTTPPQPTPAPATAPAVTGTAGTAEQQALQNLQSQMTAAQQSGNTAEVQRLQTEIAKAQAGTAITGTAGTAAPATPGQPPPAPGAQATGKGAQQTTAAGANVNQPQAPVPAPDQPPVAQPTGENQPGTTAPDQYAGWTGPTRDQYDTVNAQATAIGNQIQTMAGMSPQALMNAIAAAGGPPQQRLEKLLRDKYGVQAGAMAKQLEPLLNQWASAQKQADTLAGDWQRKGQYEQQIQDIFAMAFPEATVQIQDLDPTQQNELYRQAIKGLQNQEDPAKIAEKYKAMFPSNYDFKLADSSLNLQDPTIDPFTGIASPDITQQTVDVAGANLDKTDTSGITSGLQTAQEMAANNPALQSTLAALQEIIARGGQPDQAAIEQYLQPFYDEIDRTAEKAASVKRRELANMGGFTSGEGLNQIDSIYADANSQKKQLASDILREQMNIAANQETSATQTAASLASDITSAQVGVQGQQITAETSAAEITSGEAQTEFKGETDTNLARAQIATTLAALYQNGQLTAAGQQIDQNLSAYGMTLDKYINDQQYNLGQMELDFKERATQAGLTVQAAQMQWDSIAKSIDSAQQEAELSAKISTTIADLELKAAQGDQDAAYQVQALRVGQDLQSQGLKSEYAIKVASIAYSLLSGREQLDFETWKTLKEIDMQLQLQGGNGFLDSLLQVAGIALPFIPGVGTAGAVAEAGSSSRTPGSDGGGRGY